MTAIQTHFYALTFSIFSSIFNAPNYVLSIVRLNLSFTEDILIIFTRLICKNIFCFKTEKAYPRRFPEAGFYDLPLRLIFFISVNIIVLIHFNIFRKCLTPYVDLLNTEEVINIILLTCAKYRLC